MRKYTLVKNDDLTKLIARIGGMANQLTKDIHIACLSAAVHAAVHGNCTPINTLSDVAKNVTHNNAVMRWFGEYCPFVQYDTKEKAFVMSIEFRKAVLDNEGKIIPAVLDEYIDNTLEPAKTYLEFTPPPAFVPFNVKRMLEAIVKKADSDKRVKSERDDETGLDEVRKLLQKIAA